MAAPIQSATNATPVNGTVSATYTTTPAAGNLLLACIGINQSRNITTPAGWTLVNAVRSDGASGSGTTIGLYAKSSAGNESTVSVSFTGASANADLIIAEFAYKSVTVDTSALNGQAGTATSDTTGSITSSPPGDLVVAGFAQHAGTYNNAPTNGFTRIAVGPGPYVELFYRDYGPGDEYTSLSCNEGWSVGGGDSNIIAAFTKQRFGTPSNYGHYAYAGDGMSRSEVAN